MTRLIMLSYLGMDVRPTELAGCGHPGDRDWIDVLREVRIPEWLVDMKARCTMMCRIGTVALSPHSASVNYVTSIVGTDAYFPHTEDVGRDGEGK
jgi:hypothetical protein